MAPTPRRSSAKKTATKSAKKTATKSTRAGFEFAARLEQVPHGGPYYVSIPAAVTEAIGRRGIVPIVASVNGVADVRASMVPCGGGRHRLRLNAATRDAADVKLGQRLSMRLHVDENPVGDPVPDDLAHALREMDVFDAFRQMPVGRQNHILRWLEAAVREETREKRIVQIVESAQAWREDPRDRRWEGAGRG
ncbi:MAG: YdeI/OmpD-associated family protein [Polyangiaceae bacterium]